MRDVCDVWGPKSINVQEGINVQAGKFFKINKRTGPNKVRTGGKIDTK